MPTMQHDVDFRNSTILITGGTGSWGHEITRQLLSKYSPKEIRIFSRGEFAQVQMSRKFNSDKLSFIIGDVRDRGALSEAAREVDYVFHLAALKHVPVCEMNPWESVGVNIVGVENLIRASIDRGVKLVIDASTDKACGPLNLYGCCKSVGEKLITNANKQGRTTRFVCVRAGNVMGTNGSIIPFFQDLLLRDAPLPVTHPEMTRYFMAIEDAIGLVFKAAEHCQGGEIYVTKMPACKVTDLARAMSEFHGRECRMEFIGIRPGEKLHEMLVSEYESPYTVEDKEFRIILPMNGSLDEMYRGAKRMRDEKYTSNQELLSVKEIQRILSRAGILQK